MTDLDTIRKMFTARGIQFVEERPDRAYDLQQKLVRDATTITVEGDMSVSFPC